MLTDDENIRYVIGECFVHMEKDDAEAKLEDLTKVRLCMCVWVCGCFVSACVWVWVWVWVCVPLRRTRPCGARVCP